MQAFTSYSLGYSLAADTVSVRNDITRADAAARRPCLGLLDQYYIETFFSEPYFDLVIGKRLPAFLNPVSTASLYFTPTVPSARKAKPLHEILSWSVDDLAYVDESAEEDQKLQDSIYKLCEDTIRLLTFSKKSDKDIWKYIVLLYLALSKTANFTRSFIPRIFRIITHYPRRVVNEEAHRTMLNSRCRIVRSRYFFDCGHPWRRVTALWPAFDSIGIRHTPSPSTR